MKVLIDGFNLALDKGTGVSTYARNLSRSLKNLGYEVDVLYDKPIISSSNDLLKEVEFFNNNESRLFAHKFTDRMSIRIFALIKSVFGTVSPTEIPINGHVDTRQLASRLPQFDHIWNFPELYFCAWAYFKLTGRFLKVKLPSPPDIAHWTYPLPVKIVGAKNIYTIHDLVPLKLPFSTLDVKSDYYKLCKCIVRDADKVVTVSENSFQDIRALLEAPEDKVVNTYQAVEIPSTYTSTSLEELSTVLENLYQIQHKEYFLFVGAIEPKKNVARLLEAYIGSNIELPLVVVGPDAWLVSEELAVWNVDRTSSIHVEGNTIRKKNRVIRLDYVSFPNLVNLIRGARCLVFPSLYEGFGLPVIEAMSVGTPVITSNTGSLAEIAANAAILVDPYETREIRAAMHKACELSEVEPLIARGLNRAEDFTFDKIEWRLENLYESLRQ